MIRRRILFAVFGLVVALAGAAAFIYWSPDPRPPGPQLCLASFEEVRVGMSRDEVIATIGAPPGDYTVEEPVFPVVYLCGLELSGSETWVCDQAICLVWFGYDGRVERVDVWESTAVFPRQRPTRLELFRQRLGL